jgi:hypothetical protein
MLIVKLYININHHYVTVRLMKEITYHSLTTAKTTAAVSWAGMVPSPYRCRRGGGTRDKTRPCTRTAPHCSLSRVPPRNLPGRHGRLHAPRPCPEEALGSEEDSLEPALPGPDTEPTQPSVKENKKFKHQN